MESLLVQIRDLLQATVRTMDRSRRESDETQRLMKDWIMAAAVIDRLCFIVITLFFVVGTLTLIVLCFYPHRPFSAD